MATLGIELTKVLVVLIGVLESGSHSNLDGAKAKRCHAGPHRRQSGLDFRVSLRLASFRFWPTPFKMFVKEDFIPANGKSVPAHPGTISFCFLCADWFCRDSVRKHDSSSSVATSAFRSWISMLESFISLPLCLWAFMASCWQVGHPITTMRFLAACAVAPRCSPTK